MWNTHDKSTWSCAFLFLQSVYQDLLIIKMKLSKIYYIKLSEKTLRYDAKEKINTYTPTVLPMHKHMCKQHMWLER